jgi:hypothetical protein
MQTTVMAICQPGRYGKKPGREHPGGTISVDVPVCLDKSILDEVFGILDIVGLIMQELVEPHTIALYQLCETIFAALLRPQGQFFCAQCLQGESVQRY